MQTTHFNSRLLSGSRRISSALLGTALLLTCAGVIPASRVFAEPTLIRELARELTPLSASAHSTPAPAETQNENATEHRSETGIATDAESTPDEFIASEEVISPAEPGTDSELQAEPRPEEIERRRLNLSVGWILLIGIVCLGLLLLLMVLLIGAMMKRRTRQASPAAPLRRPLWYLETGPEDRSEPPAKEETP